MKRSSTWLCAGLIVTAFVGHACALQLLYVIPWDVYQQYLPWRDILGSAKGIPLLGIAAQTVIVVVLGRHILSVPIGFFRPLLGSVKTWMMAGFFLFASVKLTKDVAQYLFELVMVVWVSGINLLNIVLIVASLPTGFIQRATLTLSQCSGRRVLPWVVALWVTGAAAAISWFVLEGVPHIPDDVSYLFQAKYFSQGRLYLPSPPDAAAFHVSHVINDGTKWYGYGFPGWPAVLALGVLAGVPWLVNPLLAGAAILLAHGLVCRLYDRSFANGLTLLMAVSPWFLFMSASFMAHPLSLVWQLLALLAVEKERNSGRGLFGLLAGVCLGALFLTRPLEGLLVGSAVGALALGLGGARFTLRGMAGLFIGCVAVGSLLFAYNRILTGDPFYGPHMKWTDEAWYPGADRLGFGPEIGNVGWPHYDPLPGHGPIDVMLNANKNVYASNFELFGWSFGSLLFAAGMVMFGRLQRPDWIFVAILVAIIGGHSFYWSPGGADFGARYWYQTLIALIVLTLRGVQSIRCGLLASATSIRNRMNLNGFMAVASLIAFINVMPWRSVVKYDRYRLMSADVRRLDKIHRFGHSLVIVQARRPQDYASAFIFNPADLGKPGPIYVLDTGLVGRETVGRHFPDRPIWFVGRSVNDVHLRVLAGPFPPMHRSGV